MGQRTPTLWDAFPTNHHTSRQPCKTMQNVSEHQNQGNYLKIIVIREIYTSLSDIPWSEPWRHHRDHQSVIGEGWSEKFLISSEDDKPGLRRSPTCATPVLTGCDSPRPVLTQRDLFDLLWVVKAAFDPLNKWKEDTIDLVEGRYLQPPDGQIPICCKPGGTWCPHEGSWELQKKGVSQGTVLVPTLFIMLTSDGVWTRNHHLIPYANTRISMKILTVENKDTRVQSDNHKFFHYASFALEERKILKLIRIQDTDTGISEKRRVKDLGIIMSYDLTFSERNKAIIASLKKVIGWILWTFKTSG